jgi:uncharacterized protein (DUF58 family)
LAYDAHLQVYCSSELAVTPAYIPDMEVPLRKNSKSLSGKSSASSSKTGLQFLAYKFVSNQKTA